MSLQVWLPLTKDLRQQGLSDVTVTNNGATFNSAGKLGGCYYFNRSSSNYLKINNPLTSSANGVSMAFWVKLPSNGSVNDQLVHIGNGSGWTNNRFTCFVRAGSSALVFSCGDGTSNTGYNCMSSALTLNQWTHVICLYDSGKMRIYLNGTLDKEYSTTIVPSFTNVSYIGVGAGPNTTEPVTAYLNDVRIYDHALSPMEVKQISQGLVLHYPLNRNGWGQENLARNTGVRAPDSTSQVEFRAFKVGNLPIVAGETITVSFDLKMEIGTAITNGTPYLYVYNTNYRGPHGKWIAFTNKVTTPFIPIGNYAVGDIFEKRVFFTTTVASSFDPGTNTEDWIEFYSNYDTENKITINNLKIERGTIATPWCPHVEDENNMGLNSTIEYDCSGFCNNLNKNGTYSYTSDTPKYAVSTKFNGTEWMNGITPGAEIMTLACWAKTSKNKSTSQFMVADSTSNLCISFYSGCIIGVFGSTRGTGSRSTLGSSYKENDWNHFVVVKTGTSGERAIYCNGELLTPASNDYWSVASGFFIGTRNTSAALPFYGQICDVRAYATALSASDVKSLYQNCATIDPDGTIRGQIRS